MIQQYLLIISIAGMVAAIVYSISRSLMGDQDVKLRRRLSSHALDHPKTDGNEAVTPFLQRIGQMAAQPFMPKTREKQSSLRRKLNYAGIYSPAAIKIVTGSKMIFLCIGLAGGYVGGMMLDNMILGMSFGGLLGYMAPKMWLKIKIKQNQLALSNALPDALDLMVVCVEAGLTVDAAMQRVGQELGLAHPSLSRELSIAHMETRVGLPRSEALKNLATRTGNAAIQSLSAMLIQAERFGTSIAGALRIHADSLRTKRQHAAEELAAKASVKMSFPLVLFIFPATFIVLAGPTVIGLMNSALFNE